LINGRLDLHSEVDLLGVVEQIRNLLGVGSIDHRLVRVLRCAPRRGPFSQDQLDDLHVSGLEGIEEGGSIVVAEPVRVHAFLQ
jgi:hypothetical protein